MRRSGKIINGITAIAMMFAGNSVGKLPEGNNGQDNICEGGQLVTNDIYLVEHSSNSDNWDLIINQKGPDLNEKKTEISGFWFVLYPQADAAYREWKNYEELIPGKWYKPDETHNGEEVLTIEIKNNKNIDIMTKFPVFKLYKGEDFQICVNDKPTLRNAESIIYRKGIER